MATKVETPYTQRARYYSSGDAFNIKLPRIPAHVFLAERDRALDPATPTGLITLDLSGTLGCGFPATTPLILARYAPIRAGDALTTHFAATGEICYVMAGSGETVCGADALTWETGDVFCLPGGNAVTHLAGAADCLLWIVTNEPQLAFEGAQPPAPGSAPIQTVHYPGEEIRRQLEVIHRLPAEKTMTGKAVVFANASLNGQRTCLPSLTLALNSLLPHESQRAHRHNAVAVTLVVQGQQCYSMVGGTRVDWQEHAVVITPPADVHSHHNEGDQLALFLIVQDAGLHYHCRTMGFSYA
ncbi:MAG: cupin domain-containing protein [Candidatus Rokubacteria bacterium]|nr:cupin domain-containing protein [Candidatus Rokubacteria bacterium]